MRTVAIILGCLCVLAIIFLFQKTPTPSEEVLHAVINAEARAQAEGRYYNERYGFSFALPEGVQVHERKEGPESATIRIEDGAGERGFQAFVLPYGEEAISPERFQMDVPSGVRINEEVITLDGVPAVAFRSEDARLGSTREIWFIREGYLYEVTSLVKDEAWLHSVLLTWKFESIDI